jgi:uncharacterized membrane protein HdeD (DUF308 family)
MDSDNVNVTRYWWLLLVAGIIGVAAGIAAIAWAHVTVAVIAVIFGVYLLISGLIELVAGIAEDDADSTVRVLAALLGVISLIAGVIVLRHPGQSLLVIALVFGIYLIVDGVVAIYRAVGRPEGRAMRVTVGVLETIAGIIVAASPSIGLTTLVLIVGIAFIVRGIGAFIVAFQLKKLRDAGAVA